MPYIDSELTTPPNILQPSKTSQTSQTELVVVCPYEPPTQTKAVQTHAKQMHTKEVQTELAFQEQIHQTHQPQIKEETEQFDHNETDRKTQETQKNQETQQEEQNNELMIMIAPEDEQTRQFDEPKTETQKNQAKIPRRRRRWKKWPK